MLTPEEYRQAQDSPEFAELRKRFRSFVVPTTVAFLVWYFLYVLLSTYAPSFMKTKVFGNVNLGILLGLGQFVTPCPVTQPPGPPRRPLDRPDRRRHARAPRAPRVRAGRRHHRGGRPCL